MEPGGNRAMTGRRKNGKVTSFPRRRRAGYGISRLVALAGVLVLCFLFAITLVQMLQYNRLQKEVAAAEGGVAEKKGATRAPPSGARLEDRDYIEVLARSGGVCPSRRDRLSARGLTNHSKKL